MSRAVNMPKAVKRTRTKKTKKNGKKEKFFGKIKVPCIRVQ